MVVTFRLDNSVVVVAAVVGLDDWYPSAGRNHWNQDPENDWDDDGSVGKDDRTIMGCCRGKVLTHDGIRQ